MTPTRKDNPAFTRFATTTVSTEEERMAQRTNRKRIRHRPRSRGRRERSGDGLLPSPIQPAPMPMMAPTAMSVRYSYSGEAPTMPGCPHTMSAGRKAMHFSSPPDTSSSSGQGLNRKREDVWERERRIFGGSEGESGGEGLKAPMLEVVLGLFDGLDYDDDACR